FPVLRHREDHPPQQPGDAGPGHRRLAAQLQPVRQQPAWLPDRTLGDPGKSRPESGSPVNQICNDFQTFVMSNPKHRMLLLAPLVALPFLCGIFVALGGGRAKTGSRATPPPGLNLQLPESFPAVRKSLTDKLGAYQRADADSMRKREFARQDPYRSAFTTPAAPDSGHAEELLSRLNRLRASLDQQATRASPSSPGTTPPATPLTAVSVTPPGYPSTPPLPPNTQAATPISPPAPPTPTDDPQLDRLNKMLDKVIRIQHPREDNTPNPRASPGVVDELLPADSTANAIPAVVPENETLVNGTSLPLRLTDPVRLHGVVIAAGTWVY